MKAVITLNVKALMADAVEKNLFNDTQLANAIGVSVTQVWRAKTGDNSPGTAFIAGVIAEFGGPFEKFFSVEEVSSSKKQD